MPSAKSANFTGQGLANNNPTTVNATGKSKTPVRQSAKAGHTTA